MGLVQEQWEFLKDVSKLINKAEELEIVLTAGEMFRTQEQQEIYVKTGKSKTMNSNHLKRLAVDFNFFINGELVYNHDKINELARYWENLNSKNRWGGNFDKDWDSPDPFKDQPHYERKVD